MSLARRSIRSVGWNAMGSPIQITVLVLRAILLARILGPGVFGLYAMASTIVRLSALLTGLGTAAAVVNRAPETADESRALAVHFTLKSALTVVWLALIIIYALVGAGPLFERYDGLTFTLIALALITALSPLVLTPKLRLERRVQYARIAVANTLATVIGTIAALAAAYLYRDVRALIAIDLGVLAAHLLALYGWRPVWRPRLAWNADVVRYYLRFGRSNFPSVLLMNLLDRIDDLWAGFYLGDVAMGYYNRAYRFASFPRQALATPAESVARSTYAELKDDRERRSKAFFRVNALLVRVGFFVAGLMVLVAPEFIRIFLGPEWMPMLSTFRFLSFFVLLEPLKLTVAGLFVAIGLPQKVLRARILQLVVMVIGLFTLGARFGLEGVAVAVNLTLFVGLSMLLWQAKAQVDYSVRRLFGIPTLALLLGMALSLAALRAPGVLGADWRTALVKGLVFVAVYGALLFLFERRELRVAIGWILAQIAPMRRGARGGDSAESGSEKAPEPEKDS